MKKSLLILALLTAFAFQMQAQKFITRTGNISFFSETDVENIEAENNQVTSILDTESGGMVFAVLMKSFQFEKALMQEHFNEKYVESDKFPKAQFKGEIINLDEINFNEDGSYPTIVKGQMMIHGQNQEVQTEGTIVIKDGKVTANSVFELAIADYKIKIPSVVRENISEIIKITVKLLYDPYEK